MKSSCVLVLPDDHVRKFTRPCLFCTRKYERTSGFFGLWIRVLQTSFEKGHSCETYSKSDQPFQRRRFIKYFLYECPYSASSPHSSEPHLLTDQNFAQVY